MDNKRIRGWVVRILQRAYPAGIEDANIYKQLHELGYEVTKKDFEANIAYLKEDGFLEEKKFGESGFNAVLINRILKLTTKGIDIVEGTVKDEGVSL